MAALCTTQTTCTNSNITCGHCTNTRASAKTCRDKANKNTWYRNAGRIRMYEHERTQKHIQMHKHIDRHGRILHHTNNVHQQQYHMCTLHKHTRTCNSNNRDGIGTYKYIVRQLQMLNIFKTKRMSYTGTKDQEEKQTRQVQKYV